MEEKVYLDKLAKRDIKPTAIRLLILKSMSLADLYGKMAIEAQIIKMDVYHLPFLKISDFELFYNYLGSIEMK